MKNLRSKSSKSTLLLAAVTAMFMFSGCNSGMAGVSSDVDNDISTNTPVVNSANTKNPSQSSAADAQNENDDASKDTPSTVTDAQRQEYLDAINAARAETQDCGTEGVFDPVPALTWNNKLDNAAYQHSNDLAQSNTFSHTGSGTDSDITAKEKNLGRGSKFYERIRHNGYTQYRSAGENIAAGYETAQEVVDAWIESDHHCANLMSPKYTEVGMSLFEKTGSEYGFYWSQEFGGK